MGASVPIKGKAVPMDVTDADPAHNCAGTVPVLFLLKRPKQALESPG
jgi:hypothetical protein